MVTTPARDLVLLDIDGTMIDSNYLHCLAWHRAFVDLDRPVEMWRVHRAIGMGGDQLVPSLLGDDVADDVAERLSEGWKTHYRELLPEVRAVPGAKDLVAALLDQGLAVGLASSGSAEFTDAAIEIIGLDRDALAVVTTGDDAEESKPEPDIFTAAAKKAGRESALVVGDTPYDVTAAARAGMPCVTVLSGGFGVDELTAAHALAVHDDVAELAAVDPQQWSEWLGADAPAPRDIRPGQDD